MTGLDCSSREALITQLQCQHRFNPRYHFCYSFRHVAITWRKEPIEAVLNHANRTAGRWRSQARQVEPMEANIHWFGPVSLKLGLTRSLMFQALAELRL